jgi:hypothetical protein
MVNTLFASHLIDSKGRHEVDEPIRQTTEIKDRQQGVYHFFALPVCHGRELTSGDPF